VNELVFKKQPTFHGSFYFFSLLKYTLANSDAEKYVSKKPWQSAGTEIVDLIPHHHTHL